MKRSLATRPFRIVDGMVLVAATAIAFAIVRPRWPASRMGFSTFGGHWEQWLFVWMHQVVPFPALWSFAVFVIAWRDRCKGQRPTVRSAGIVACYAATAALAVASLISSAFHVIHFLEDHGVIPKILSHPTHQLSPFDNAPLEELIGAAVLGAWSALAAIRRWRAEPSWIDRLGQLLGVFWIGLFVTYLYAYSG
jgi:hypothetical protein